MKNNDWISTADPPTTVSYDVRNPPSSNVIATRTYSGPRLDVCGDPVLELKSDGQLISFLSYTFDSASKVLSIQLKDPTTAIKGVYNVDAVFSSPGVYTWSLGLTLTVFDICDSSKFPNAPVISSATSNYLVGQGLITFDV